jgi:hypothetical protein
MRNRKFRGQEFALSLCLALTQGCLLSPCRRSRLKRRYFCLNSEDLLEISIITDDSECYLQKKKEIPKDTLNVRGTRDDYDDDDKQWRRERDLNPRYPFGVHTLSRRAP